MELGSILALSFILSFFLLATIICFIVYSFFINSRFQKRKPLSEEEAQLEDFYDIVSREGKLRAEEFLMEQTTEK